MVHLGCSCVSNEFGGTTFASVAAIISFFNAMSRLTRPAIAKRQNENHTGVGRPYCLVLNGR